MDKQVAFIPVRGGSKSIRNKNIREIGGRPLVWWVTAAASRCEALDRVYVATDSDEIARCVRAFSLPKVEVIGRGAHTATDTASTESALLEFCERYAFETVALIQATSPLLAAEDLARGFAALAAPGVDSVLSVVEQKRFIWRRAEHDLCEPVNYDPFDRPRRQDFGGYLVENGAFYITSRQALLRSRNRISGNVAPVVMDAATFTEIDEPADWELVDQLLLRRAGIESASPLPCPDPFAVSGEIRMLLTDCDGCLTDGGMYYDRDGDALKKFNTRDGLGLRVLREAGLLTGIVTGEDADSVRRRAEKLGLPIYKAGVRDKLPVVEALCEEHGLTLGQVAYIGDDLLDLEVLRVVGLACAPADAMPQIKAAAHYVTAAKGGEGVIREVADLLLARKHQ